MQDKKTNKTTEEKRKQKRTSPTEKGTLQKCKKAVKYSRNRENTLTRRVRCGLSQRELSVKEISGSESSLL